MSEEFGLISLWSPLTYCGRLGETEREMYRKRVKDTHTLANYTLREDFVLVTLIVLMD